MNYSHRTTPVWITKLDLDEIFGFGSNLAGRHGAGAAKMAKEKFGAKNGQGEGLQGRCYAIPVKDGRYSEDPKVKRSLPLDQIQGFITTYIEVAKSMPLKTFLTPEIGCGLAGYTPEQMAPLFAAAIPVENIHLPARFWKILIK